MCVAQDTFKFLLYVISLQLSHFDPNELADSDKNDNTGFVLFCLLFSISSSYFVNVIP
jgi:hypothetical protein